MAYTAGSERLWDATLWPDVLFLALVVIPAIFLVPWLALPAAFGGRLLYVGLGLVVVAVLLRLAGLEVLFNFAKLFALVALGFWFLSYFETVAWAVLVAAIIPWVDIWSVFFGPTGEVTENRPGIFEAVSIEFALPGHEDGARIGPPDILFFSLFLAAAARFKLRVAWTWIGMTASLGLTLVLTAATQANGLPALPAICVGFLLPNADLLWRALSPPTHGTKRETHVLDGLKAGGLVFVYLTIAVVVVSAVAAVGGPLAALGSAAAMNAITAAVLHPRALPPGARRESWWIVSAVILGPIPIAWLAWLAVTKDRWPKDGSAE